MPVVSFNWIAIYKLFRLIFITYIYIKKTSFWTFTARLEYRLFIYFLPTFSDCTFFFFLVCIFNVHNMINSLTCVFTQNSPTFSVTLVLNITCIINCDDVTILYFNTYFNILLLYLFPSLCYTLFYLYLYSSEKSQSLIKI